MDIKTTTSKSWRHFIPEYFKERNGVSIDNFRENENYTEETITYMPSYKLADETTQHILNCVPNDQSVVVVECCSGIGGNTVSFLDSNQVKAVFSFEIDPIRRSMLEKNIETYRFTPKSMVLGEFKGIKDFEDMVFIPNGKNIKETYNTSSVVFYMDPPWLDQKPGHVSSYKDYILSGIKLSGKTLETLIAESRGIADLIVIRVPPSYNLKQVEGFVYYPVVFPKRETSLFYFIYPEGSPNIHICPDTKDSLPTSTERPRIGSRQIKKRPIIEVRPAGSIEVRPAGSIESTKPVRKPPIAPPKPSAQIAVPIKPGARITSKQAIQLPNISRQTAEEFRIWKLNLRSFLFNLLAVDMFRNEKDQLVNTLLTEYNMDKYWIPAFTHISYDPNSNYESLEFYGDRCMKSNFGLYVKDTYGNIYQTEDQLTKLSNHYLSKTILADLAKKFNMTEYVRLFGVESDIHINEDLTESFAGALLMAGDDGQNNQGFSNFGRGNVLVYEYTAMLFDSVELDSSIIEGDAKTQVKEIFDKMRWSGGSDIQRDLSIAITKIQSSLGNPEEISNIMKSYKSKTGPITETKTNPDGRSHSVIKLPPEAYSNLRSSLKIKTDIIGQGTGNSQKESLKEAYQNALYTLRSYGFTPEYLTGLANDRFLNNSELTNTEKEEFLSKLRSDRYDSFFFRRVKVKKNYRVLQLIGISSGREEILGTSTGTREFDIQRKLLQIYIRNI